MQHADQFRQERFVLRSSGLELQVFVAIPPSSARPLPSVQIHHGGGGFEPLYEQMATALAQRGLVGIAMVHRGFPGSDGHMEYGKGEIVDIGNLADEMRDRCYIDPDRMGILGYSRGAHSTLLALECHDCFRAGVVWSAPVDMARHVRVHPWIQQIIGGTPAEVPEEYACRSPLGSVERIQCPVLILHGEQDDVVPVEHARLLAGALEARGKPFELEILPEEGHIWSTPGLRTVWGRTLAFLEQRLMTEY